MSDTFRSGFDIKKEDLMWLVSRTHEVYSKHEMGVYSGNTTFYLLISFVPMMMMVISIINVIPWFSVLDVNDLLMKIIPDIPQVRNALLQILINVNHQSGTLVISLFAITSLWSGSHGISALMAGLEKINHTQRPYVHDKLKSIIYAILFCLLIPSMLLFQMLRGSLKQVINNFFALISLPEIGLRINHFLQYSGVITLAGMVLVIVLTYTYLPAGKRKIRKQLPGSVFSSVIWVVFTKLFGFCIKRFWSMSSVYGTLGAIFLASMWLKFIITFLFYGASLNRALQVIVSRDCET